MASTGKSGLLRIAPIGGQLGFARQEGPPKLRNEHVDYLEFVTRWLDLLARRPNRHVLRWIFQTPHHLANHSPYFGDASHSTLAPTARRRLRTSATN
jgi:hypothetical protein